MERLRRASAEALGTMFLVATVVGSGIMAERLTETNGALTLLCNTLPTGAILTVLILALAPLSGAHFNPAVTVAFAIRGDLNQSYVLPYVTGQVAGGLVGVALANWLFALPMVELSTQPRGGIELWASEIVATFGLMLAIVATLRHGTAAVAASVGLYISAAYWFTPSTSFANPAVTLARALTDTFTGIAPENVPPFILAQLIGAAGAIFLFQWLDKGQGELA